MRLRTTFLALLCCAGLMIPAKASEPVRVVPQSKEQLVYSFGPVVRAVAPAVVNIYTKKTVKVEARRSPFFDDPFFKRFFGEGFGGSAPQERIQRSLGSGVIVGESGVIVTSEHVIGEADQITVVLNDRREFEATVVLADKSTDLAVLKIETKDDKLPYLEFLDSDGLEVGDVVLAIGNPFGVGQTVTSGIVSALARTNVGVSDYQFFIQTDAAINPGNSGGALVTLDGKLAGINTAIYSRSGGSIGIGFAIPSNMANSVVVAALSDGKILRPWVGASGQEMTADIAEVMGQTRPVGVLVNQLYPGGPADKAGIRVGDIIMSVDGNEVYSIEGLRFRLRLGKGGVKNAVPIRLLRDGKEKIVQLKLVAAPEVPPRNVAVVEDDNFFKGVKIGNMSPAFAEELKLDAFLSGVVVLELDRRSIPARYGLLRPGDIVVEVNGIAIKTVAEMADILARKDAEFRYKIRRGDTSIECGQNQDGSFGCRK